MADETRAQPAASQAHWTTRALLRWMIEYFESREVDSPRITSELLLCEALGCERLRLYMEVDRPASPDELARLRDYVRRVGGHEPVQYVLGEAIFYGRSFEVNSSTLIPRPCTETLVALAVRRARERRPGGQPLRALDVGTGSGCIAIMLALEVESAVVVATDIDELILALAQRNAERHGVSERIDVRLGELFEPVESEPPFELICANPPYIPDHEWADVAPNVRDHEPQRALRGGADGLDVIRRIIAEAPQRLSEGGGLLIEIADCQRDAVIELCNSSGRYEDVSVLKDDEGFWRVLRAQRA